MKSHSSCLSPFHDERSYDLSFCVLNVTLVIAVAVVDHTKKDGSARSILGKCTTLM